MSGKILYKYIYPIELDNVDRNILPKTVTSIVKIPPFLGLRYKLYSKYKLSLF